MQATLNQQPNDRSFALPTRPTESRRAPPSQDRPFSCPIPTCGGRFHRKFTLHEHMKTHTGEQPHQCPVAGCGKRFSTSGNLARHRKLHAVHKLNCPTPHCSREFTSREKLMRHLKVHLAGTPHSCTIEGCGKTFSTAGNLTRHRRTRHNAPPLNRAAGMDAPRQPPMLKSFPFPGQQQRQFPMQALPSRMMVHYPVVPGAMLVKAPVWSAAPTQEALAAATARPDYNRISDQDVRDLLDCLFVENPAVAPVSNMGGIIRSEPFLRGAYHPEFSAGAALFTAINGLDESVDGQTPNQTQRRGDRLCKPNGASDNDHRRSRCILERTSLRRGEPLWNQRKRRYVSPSPPLDPSPPFEPSANNNASHAERQYAGPPFYLQRSTSGQQQQHPQQHQDPTANLAAGAGANLGPGANVNANANAPRRPGTSRRAAPSEDRPFSCPVPNCGGRFHRKFTLHEHLKTHTGEQPHQCPVAECGKRFSTSGNLARHRKLHAMRKISCPAAHCTRVFTSREKLVPHLKVHLARTPHTCDFAGCGKTFSTAGNLTRHRRTQHRAGPSTRQESAPAPAPMPTMPRPKFEYSDRNGPPPTGQLPMRGLLWPTPPPPVQNPPNQRILESDVQDLFDCLFVENAQAAAAAAAANGHHHQMGYHFGHHVGHHVGHNVGVIRDRLPKLEPPRENKSVPHAQAPYLTATYEF